MTEKIEIRWSRDAVKDLARLHNAAKKRVIVSIAALATNPFPRNSKPLRGFEDLHRLRVGDYRVVYRFYKGTLIITVISARHRRDVYKTLPR